MGKDLKGKELGTGLSQRKDGRYSAKITLPNGKRVEKYFSKISEAKRWYVEQQHNKIHGICIDPNVTVDSFYEFWIKNCKEDIVRDNTVKNYKRQYNLYIKNQIGFMKLKDVKPIHCQNVLNLMYEDGYAYGTMNLTKITLHAIFKAAVLNDYIYKNPVNELVQPKKREDPKQRVLTIEEQKLFVEYSRGTMYDTAYNLVLQTGMRAGEVGGLKWSDIDYEKNIIHIKRTLLESKEKGGFYFGEPKCKSSIRDIPLTEEAKNFLHEQKLKQARFKLRAKEWSDKWDGLVFTTIHGNPVGTTTFNNMMNRVVKQINQDKKIWYNTQDTREEDRIYVERIYMHALRHTFATRCIEAGMNPKTLQVILGHSTFAVTMDMYVHVLDDNRTSEMEKIEKYIKVVS